MKVFLFLIVLFFTNVIKSQIRVENQSQLTIEEAFRPKMPEKRDTIYYPFYNGVQMIEVDHIGFRDRKVFFLEQSQPRAMSYSDMIPMPIGNEYFFRDTLGVIVKAFNSGTELNSLTKHFNNVPLNIKSKLSNFFPYHNNQQYRYDGVWAYSANYLFNFKGHYKVSANSVVEVLEESKPMRMSSYGVYNSSANLFGLIDSLGTVIIPLEYDEIIPWHDNLIVSKNGKWGIINYSAETIVPLIYDSYNIVHENTNFYPNKKFNIYFLNTKKLDQYKTQYSIEALYNSVNNNIIKLNGYNEIHNYGRYKDINEYNNRKMIVIKDGKKGVINSAYEEVVAPQFDMFDHVGDLIHVNKNGEFGFLNKNYEVEISLAYDYAQYIDNSTFLVLKNGNYYCIDSDENRKECINLKPKWKIVHFSVAIDNFVGIQVGDHIGVLDTLNNKMVLPIKYEKGKSISSVYYSEFMLRYDSIFKQKKLTVRENSDIYDEISFSNNKIIVKNSSNLYGVIDTSFNILIDFKYEYLKRYPRNPEYLIYRKNEKEGVMDFSKKIIISGKYDNIRIERDRPLLQVQDKGNWGIVNLNGDVVIDCQYDSIRFLGHWDRQKENLWIVNRGKKYGVINDKNEVMIPFIYDGISHLHANNLWVMDKDNKRYKVYYSNQKGLKKPD